MNVTIDKQAQQAARDAAAAQYPKAKITDLPEPKWPPGLVPDMQGAVSAGAVIAFEPGDVPHVVVGVFASAANGSLFGVARRGVVGHASTLGGAVRACLRKQPPESAAPPASAPASEAPARRGRKKAAAPVPDVPPPPVVEDAEDGEDAPEGEP